MPSRTRKFRGLRTHGRGKKSGRGAGIHGGRGNAGLHKHRFLSMLKYAPDHFGHRGFKRNVPVKECRTLNIGELELMLPHWLHEKKEHVRQSGEGYELNLTALGIDKLLGGGKVGRAFNVTVSRVSAGAREKLEAAGGKVIIPTPTEERETKS